MAQGFFIESFPTLSTITHQPNELESCENPQNIRLDSVVPAIETNLEVLDLRLFGG